MNLSNSETLVSGCGCAIRTCDVSLLLILHEPSAFLTKSQLLLFLPLVTFYNSCLQGEYYCLDLPSVVQVF